MIDVIIADDHSLFRQGFERLLETLENINKIYHAENGNQVLDLLKKQKVDLIFMDIRMAELNGIEATLKVKQKYPDVKIIAISMMDDKSNILKMIKAGADGYLLKNTSFVEIKLAIQNVINGINYYAESIAKIISENTDKVNLITDSSVYPELSSKEKEITVLICLSMTNKKISELLNISVRTVESYRTRIYSKLGIDNVVDLIFYAIETGLLKKDSDAEQS